MSNAHDEQHIEYRDIKDWLAGKKPPAQGRSWRRVVVAVMPSVVREPLEQRFGEGVWDHVGGAVVSLLVGLAMAFGIHMLAGSLLAAPPTPEGQQIMGTQVLLQVLGFLHTIFLPLGITLCVVAFFGKLMNGR